MKTITISYDRYKELVEDQAFLQDCFSMGLDNWEGFNDAINVIYDDRESFFTKLAQKDACDPDLEEMYRTMDEKGFVSQENFWVKDV